MCIPSHRRWFCPSHDHKRVAFYNSVAWQQMFSAGSSLVKCGSLPLLLPVTCNSTFRLVIIFLFIFLASSSVFSWLFNTLDEIPRYFPHWKVQGIEPTYPSTLRLAAAPRHAPGRMIMSYHCGSAHTESPSHQTNQCMTVVAGTSWWGGAVAAFSLFLWNSMPFPYHLVFHARRKLSSISDIRMFPHCPAARLRTPFHTLRWLHPKRSCSPISGFSSFPWFPCSS